MLTVDEARELYHSNLGAAVNAFMAEQATLDHNETLRRLRTITNQVKARTRRQVNDDAVWARVMTPTASGRGRSKQKVAMVAPVSNGAAAAPAPPTRKQRRSA